MTLQSEEQISEECRRKPSQGTAVTSYVRHQEMCVHTDRTHINIPIPLTATPGFITDIGGSQNKYPEKIIPRHTSIGSQIFLNIHIFTILFPLLFFFKILSLLGQDAKNDFDWVFHCFSGMCATSLKISDCIYCIVCETLTMFQHVLWLFLFMFSDFNKWTA